MLVAQRALGQHQGAPRLLDRAVRRPRRDGHAGRAHPRPPRRDARVGRGGPATRTTPAAAHGSSTIRIAAGRTCPTSRSSRRSSTTDGALLGFSASRAHHADVGGRVPGSMPFDSRTLDEEGVVIAPRVLDDAAIDELAAADAPAGRAARRPARATGGQPPRRDADARAGGAARRRRAARRLRRGPRLRRAPHARLPARPPRRHAPRGRRPGGRRRRPRAARRGDRRRRPADPRLPRQRRPGPRQPQLPARRHAQRLPLRRARAHRRRHPAERGRAPAGRGHHRARDAARRAGARRGGRPATSRRPRASPTSCSRPSAAPAARAP